MSDLLQDRAQSAIFTVATATQMATSTPATAEHSSAESA